MDCPLKEHTMKQGIREEPGGPIFYFPFSATAISSAVTAGYDLFCATAPSNSRVALRAIKLGQHTEFADAQAELLSLLIMTGSTAPSSGGAPITGVNAKRYSGAATAASSVTVRRPRSPLRPPPPWSYRTVGMSPPAFSTARPPLSASRSADRDA